MLETASGLRNFGGSTQVPLGALKCAKRGTWGFPLLQLARRI